MDSSDGEDGAKTLTLDTLRRTPMDPTTKVLPNSTNSALGKPREPLSPATKQYRELICPFIQEPEDGSSATTTASTPPIDTPPSPTPPAPKPKKKKRGGKKVRAKKAIAEAEQTYLDAVTLLDAATDDGIVNRTALFELRPAPGKGLGLFARCDIPAGTRILAEKPLIVLPMTLQGKELDEKIEEAVDCMPLRARKVFLDLARGVSVERVDSKELIEKEVSGAANGTAGTSSDPAGDLAEAMGNLAINGSGGSVSAGGDVDASPAAITGIFHANAFGLEDNKSIFARAVFPLASRLNHSCIPNICCAYNENIDLHTAHTVRDIKAGEELLVSYINGSFLSRDERQLLLGRRGFQCTCQACEDNTMESEGRRLYMKTLSNELTEYRKDEETMTEAVANEAAGTLEELASIMLEEGLQDAELAHTYRGAVFCCLRASRPDDAEKFRQLAYEVLVDCHGVDSNLIDWARSYEWPSAYDIEADDDDA